MNRVIDAQGGVKEDTATEGGRVRTQEASDNESSRKESPISKGAAKLQSRTIPDLPARLFNDFRILFPLLASYDPFLSQGNRRGMISISCVDWNWKLIMPLLLSFEGALLLVPKEVLQHSTVPHRRRRIL